MCRRYDDAVSRIAPSLSHELLLVGDELKARCFEVRLRVGAPVMLCTLDGTFFVCQGGKHSRLRQSSTLIATRGDVADTFARLSGYSLHSHTRDIAQGFVGLEGGHRAGLCGTAVVSAGEVSSVQGISSINLRIARENKSAALELCSRVFSRGLSSIVISGEPSSGKTTMLRDLARRLCTGLCDGNCYRVVVVDERGELCAVRGGEPSFDMGNGCDIMTGWPKAAAVTAAVRSMSPDIIVCDEIADSEQLRAVAQGFGCGVHFAVSVHASCKREILMRPLARELLRTGAFDHIVQLRSGGKPCTIGEIYAAGELARAAGV